MARFPKDSEKQLPGMYCWAQGPPLPPGLVQEATPPLVRRQLCLIWTWFSGHFKTLINNFRKWEQICRDQTRSVVMWEWRGNRGGAPGKFWGEGDVCYLDCGDGYKGVYIDQKGSDCTR